MVAWGKGGMLHFQKTVYFLQVRPQMEGVIRERLEGGKRERESSREERSQNKGPNL